MDCYVCSTIGACECPDPLPESPDHCPVYEFDSDSDSPAPTRFVVDCQDCQMTRHAETASDALAWAWGHIC